MALDAGGVATEQRAGCLRDFVDLSHNDQDALARAPAIYAALREYAPVIHVPELDVYVVTGYQLAVEVLTDPDTFSSQAAPGETLYLQLMDLMNRQRIARGKDARPVQPQPAVLLQADPPRHTEQRAVVRRMFSPRRIAQLEDEIAHSADQVIDGFVDKGSCELIADYATPLPARMIAGIMGISLEDLADFQRWAEALAAPIGHDGPLPDDALIAAGASLLEWDQHCRTMIRDRIAHPGDDLISEVVGAGEDGELPLPEDELVIMLAQFMVAGNETSAKLITSAARVIAEDPQLAAQLRANPSAIKDFIEEVVRLNAPIQGLWRVATRDVDLAGVAIPAGARVQVLFAAANQDPDVFSEPTCLRTDREGTKLHLAFGVGVHYCIGAPLGRAQGRIGIERLLARLDDIRIAAEFQERYQPNHVLRGLTELPIVFTARSS